MTGWTIKMTLVGPSKSSLRINGPITEAQKDHVLRILDDDFRDDNAGALRLIADIRAACGDNGRRMQDDLVEYIGEIKRQRDEMLSTMIAALSLTPQGCGAYGLLERALNGAKDAMRDAEQK